MMSFRWLASALVLAPLASGCSKQEPCDSNEFICDTAAYWDRKHSQKPDPTSVDPTDGTWIEIVRLPGCAGDPDMFRVSVRVNGSTNGASRVNIWESDAAGGFNETHPLVDADPRAQFEELLVELRDDSSPQQYAPGQRTTYECGVSDVGRVLTYAIRVYDDKDDYADCAVFSTEVDSAKAIADLFSGDLPEPNEVKNRDELNEEDCRVWSVPTAD